MNFNKKSHIVDLSKAIRITDVRLHDILAQHAERLGELDAEDPAPALLPAYSFMSERVLSVSDLLIETESAGS